MRRVVQVLAPILVFLLAVAFVPAGTSIGAVAEIVRLTPEQSDERLLHKTEMEGGQTNMA